MKDNRIKGRPYQTRRREILASAQICSICSLAVCPHCAGEKPWCRGIGHLDHGKSRKNGGAVDASNESGSHACCNLKKGANDVENTPLGTSRQW